METNINKPAAPQPRNIFECINANVVAMSEDLNLMHTKVDDMQAKINLIYSALFPAQGIAEEQPNAVGGDSATI